MCSLDKGLDSFNYILLQHSCVIFTLDLAVNFAVTFLPNLLFFYLITTVFMSISLCVSLSLLFELKIIIKTAQRHVCTELFVKHLHLEVTLYLNFVKVNLRGLYATVSFIRFHR